MPRARKQMSRLSVGAGVSALALLTAAAACASSSTAPSTRTVTTAPSRSTQLRPTGTVVGRVFGFGGPYPGRTIGPTAGGRVTLVGGGHRHTATYAPDGRFTIDLPPGVYRIEAAAFDGLTCTGEVTVTANEHVDASAVCPIP